MQGSRAEAGQRSGALVVREHTIVGQPREVRALLDARQADGTLIGWGKPRVLAPDRVAVQAHILTPAPTAPVAAPSWWRRHWWQVVIAVVLVLAAGGYGLYRALEATLPHWEVFLVAGMIFGALYLAKRHDLESRRSSS